MPGGPLLGSLGLTIDRCHDGFIVTRAASRTSSIFRQKIPRDSPRERNHSRSMRYGFLLEEYDQNALVFIPLLSLSFRFVLPLITKFRRSRLRR